MKSSDWKIHRLENYHVVLEMVKISTMLRLFE